MKNIEDYVRNFPQLTLGVGDNIKDSEEYKNIVLRGYLPTDLSMPVEISGNEEVIEVDTPIGKTEVLYLPVRETFEYFVRCLANRCTNVEIPKTTGAIFISGLNNWRKIDAHKEEFLRTHNESEWDDEFDKFTSVRENYRSSVLIISKGNYSAVTCDKVGFEQEEWYRLSKEIRIYHEITHQISRKLFADHVDAVRDEVLADCIGIYGALGKYDAEIERRVLGIYDGKYVSGSRLQNYVEESDLPRAVEYAKQLIDKLELFISQHNNLKPFELLIKIEEEYIK